MDARYTPRTCNVTGTGENGIGMLKSARTEIMAAKVADSANPLERGNITPVNFGRHERRNVAIRFTSFRVVLADVESTESRLVLL